MGLFYGNVMNVVKRRLGFAPAGTALFRIASQFQRFIRIESFAGVLLLLCAVTALAWANSPWSESYHRLWQTEISVAAGSATISKTLLHWINDGLMVVFFFVVGLEIKRELLVGELASLRQAMLPIAAAVGGMVVPAIFYGILNAGTEGAAGWGIPMATDIAFAIGVLALLGNRVPLGLKIFLTALAIVDDLGAVLVIAVFYTSELSFDYLALGLACLAVLSMANWMGVRRPVVYGLLGLILWFAFLKSGVHATIAGVLLAMTIPGRPRTNRQDFLNQARELLNIFESESANPKLSQSQLSTVRSLEEQCEAVQPPMQRLEHSLHPLVSYLIMPVFALANAGVTATGGMSSALIHPITLGIVFGLLLGKQVGITFFAWLAVRAGVAALPAQIRWRHVYRAGWVGGIGFTMSLFIASLAFGEGPLLDLAKVGILVASALSGIGGFIVLRTTRVAVQ
jgi:NhaA family Na+:H+ antiporter